jgi:hypothetical protein
MPGILDKRTDLRGVKGGKGIVIGSLEARDYSVRRWRGLKGG